jgi:outer membrane protein OmpA-like peptidoglycan-associated protein
MVLRFGMRGNSQTAFKRPINRLAALLIVTLCLGCGAKRELTTNLASCKRVLSTCQYDARKLADKNQQCRARAQQGEQPQFLSTWQAANQAVATKIMAMFRTYQYNLEQTNGALVFSLPLERLFEYKKSALTEKGKEIVLRLSQIAKEIQDRDMVVICRSVDFRLEDRSKSAHADRALSLKRASTVAKKLGKVGINPMSIGASGYPGGMDGQFVDSLGRFEFMVQPLPHEMPQFPDEFLLQSAPYTAVGASGP